MTRAERLVNAHLARRLRRIRLEEGESACGLAKRMGMPLSTFHARESGIAAVGFDFLLRFQLVLGLDIRHIWLPVSERIECVDDEVIRRLLEGFAQQQRAVTEEDVLEIAASVFQLPLGAITGGFQHRTPVRARAAAAFIVAGHPLLKLARLARLVSRTEAALLNIRYRASAYGPDFWRKVEAIRAEVESL